ncbi:MAG: low molecular weight protein-tyrosine-phosphatase [Pseudomonadota bacterium]
MRTSILFVCMGNICRSPTAKGVFDRALTEAGLDVRTESAGTHGYHVGDRPDSRSIKMAAARGIDIADDRSRRVQPDDFERFDWILAMDEANLRALQALQPAAPSGRLQLIMDLVPDYGLREVPDPYYGGEHGFVQVVDMLEHAARAMVDRIQGLTTPQ